MGPIFVGKLPISTRSPGRLVEPRHTTKATDLGQHKPMHHLRIRKHFLRNVFSGSRVTLHLSSPGKNTQRNKEENCTKRADATNSGKECAEEHPPFITRTIRIRSFDARHLQPEPSGEPFDQVENATNKDRAAVKSQAISPPSLGSLGHPGCESRLQDPFERGI